MSKLLFDSGTFKTNVNKLANSIEEFRNIAEDFFIFEEQLRGAWQGKANESYFNKLSEKKNDLAKIYTHYGTLLESLGKVGSGFQEIDSEYAGQFIS